MKKVILLDEKEWALVAKVLNDARYLANSAEEGKYRGQLELLAYDLSPLNSHIRELDIYTEAQHGKDG